ncbi:isoamyl acetate-hydrolyzing esterase 1, partial [Achlya hypogyna]
MSDVDARGRFLTLAVVVLASFFFASGTIVLYLIQAPGYEPTTVVARVPTIVVAGDSITEYGAAPNLLGYEALLANDYVRRADVLNRGFAGWTTRDFLTSAVPPLVAELVATPPVLVTILLGSNDAVLPGNYGHADAATFAANLVAIASKLREVFPKTHLLLMTPPPVDDSLQAGSRSNSALAAYAREVQSVGAALNASVVDVFGTWRATDYSSYLREDGLHLTKEGNQALHDLMLQGIRSAYPSVAPEALPRFYPLQPRHRLKLLDNKAMAGRSHAQRLEAWLGVVYVLLSLCGCVWYTHLLRPSFANDLWWAGYNITGHQAFLLDLVNQFLATNTNGTLDVLSPSATVLKTYTGLDASTLIYTPYMHDVVLGQLTSVEYAVPQLRRLSTYWCMRMNVQHCWVDFNRSFEMAHTVLRQQRCLANYRHNAAVYMEAILRNQPWVPYLALWGGVGLRFNVAIQRGLEETQRGRDFLAQMATAYASTSVADELAYWAALGLTTFELQWQTRWQPGVSETIVVKNALGMQQQLTLKALDQVTGPWSSQSLFWMPLNDLYNGMIMNRSLIRGTSRYFGANVSTQLPAINLESFRGMADARGNLVGKAWVFHNFVGTYLSIDCRYKLRPPELVAVYNRFHKVLFDQLGASPELFDSYTKLLTPVLAPTPPTWLNHTFYGGDPMCILGSGTTYVQQSFDFFDDCSQKSPLTVQPTAPAFLFGVLAKQTTTPTSVAAICALQESVQCSASLSVAVSFLQKLVIPSDLTALLRSIPPIIQAIDVGFMQFATTRNGSWTLLQQPLIGADGAWSFYGWCFLADWATGLRQAVAFEGDASTITVLSNAYSGQRYITSDQPLEVATTTIFYLVVSTTVYLLGVGVLIVVYVLRTRGNIVGRNLLRFNRLAGSVWVGRNLLLMRGMSAVLILSTAQTSLVVTHGYTSMVATPRPWLATAVLAGETTWLGYCLNEYLVVVLPKSLTFVYSPISSILAWLVVTILEVTNPVHVSISVDRVCSGADMDFGVFCTAGVVHVGDFNRILWLVGSQALAVLVAIIVAHVCCHRFGFQRPPEEESLLISGLPAVTISADTQRDYIQFYDEATCLLCGLIPLSSRGRRYVFDLKLWSLFPDTVSTDPQSDAVIRDADFATRVSSMAIARPPPSMDLIKIAARQGRRGRVIASGFGLAYIVSAIASSISYFEVTKTNLANDLYWAGFNVTGAHAFFATWLNEQLVLGAKDLTTQLDSPSINQLGTFATNPAFVTTVNNYGAWLQHNELNRVESAIAGLRVSDACMTPWIFTQYCYLDFNQMWPMAYSARRQMRCQSMTGNGAVFLESVLRNIDWGHWTTCWGDAFAIAFGNELQTTSQGQAWLHGVATARLSLADEASYWRAHGVQSFDVQWQNYKRIGAINSYSITNAYGVAYPMTLMALNGTYRWSVQTSYKMYWSLANDLTAVMNNASGIGGTSLLRDSSHFAFANTTMQAVLTTNLTLMAPLANGLALVAAAVGPFGVSDMVYVRVPAAVSSLFRDILETMRLALADNVTAQAAYTAIVPLGTSYP